jgi:peroxiredoxin
MKGEHIMSNKLKPGATFPDYELPDQDGVLQRLSALQGIDPMVVMLSRGSY